MYWFCYNTKNEEKISSFEISIDEFEKADNIFHRLMQKESFSGRMYLKIRALRPLKDKSGLLRAKTNVI